MITRYHWFLKPIYSLTVLELLWVMIQEGIWRIGLILKMSLDLIKIFNLIAYYLLTWPDLILLTLDWCVPLWATSDYPHNWYAIFPSTAVHLSYGTQILILYDSFNNCYCIHLSCTTYSCGIEHAFCYFQSSLNEIYFK